MLIPKLRFKREDGTDYPEWNSKSFSDTFSSLNNNTFSRNMLSESGSVCNIHYGDIFVKYGEICDVQKENIPKVNDHIDTGKYDLLQDGDIILADTAEDETVGKATEILNVGTATVISGLHTMACRPNYKFAPMYLGYYINSPTYHNQLLPFMQGIKVTSIGRKNISETSISFPCLEEQQKIADFLSTVDEVIAQSEAEVANLQQQKKAAMQKIFSQEVRFKREDGTSYPEWEEKKLGAIGKAIIGSGFSKKYQGHKDLPIPFYKVSDMNNVGNEIVMNNSNNYVSEELLLKMGLKACQQNAIIFAKVGAALMLDRKRIANKPFLVDNNMMIFMPNENNELRYIYHWLTSIRLSKYAQIGALPSFNASDIEYVVIPLPCLEEQQKIADFLATYDEAISCAKQELDKWKELKKGLLQQMFA